MVRRDKNYADMFRRFGEPTTVAPRYFFYLVRADKRKAKVDAAILRARGHRARVTAEKFGYVVWRGPRKW